MLTFLRSLFVPKRDGRGDSTGAVQAEPPAVVAAHGVEALDLASSLQYVNELPVPDWEHVSAWIESIPSPQDQAKAWAACEVAWLHHLGFALGPRYRLAELDGALLLSSLERKIAGATLAFMVKTLSRITRLLDGLAQAPEWGKDILIVFDDHETYYRYVSRYYREDGEFAGSSGMHIGAGCSHFVTMKADLRSIEPVVAHEMTHGCLGHLPIPAWLNEGIAVNTEQRLCPAPPPLFTPQEMHEKHLRFWGEAEIQQFWSGKSFLRNDDGNMLSYDLARILVSQFASRWDAFREFARHANLSDAGASAAREHLGLELGDAAAAILERELGERWQPDPDSWNEAPEKGAFREQQVGSSRNGDCRTGGPGMHRPSAYNGIPALQADRIRCHPDRIDPRGRRETYSKAGKPPAPAVERTPVHARCRAASAMKSATGEPSHEDSSRGLSQGARAAHDRNGRNG